MLLGKSQYFSSTLDLYHESFRTLFNIKFLVFKNQLSFLLHYQEKQTDDYGISFKKKLWSKVKKRISFQNTYSLNTIS